VAADVSNGASPTAAAASDSSGTTAAAAAVDSSGASSSANGKGKAVANGQSPAVVEVDETGPGGAQDASAVYKADDAGSLLSVSASHNALSLVLRDDAAVLSFIKYVSSAAPGSRYDIAAEYVVDAGSGSSSDSEDAETDAAAAAGSSGAGSSSNTAAAAAAEEPSSKRSKLNPA
jgi:Oxoglutarate and iron-dependent oxygenase degradation C-term